MLDLWFQMIIVGKMAMVIWALYEQVKVYIAGEV